ncbi:hypothetical protein NPIL_576291 [Nephila pilipes]|uniref:Uncharacterized protein n=1 Tax=Nephila pilipes TaxID=299642 RepID=A0A8X6NFG4_NEPPI|nr:hypothetical protein NPIL_576291 [Nephila pilipes]
MGCEPINLDTGRIVNTGESFYLSKDSHLEYQPYPILAIIHSSKRPFHLHFCTSKMETVNFLLPIYPLLQYPLYPKGKKSHNPFMTTPRTTSGMAEASCLSSDSIVLKPEGLILAALK